MVRIRPGISPLRERTVGEVVEDTLEWILLGSKKDEVFKRVWAPRVIEDFCSYNEVALDDWG